jgi:hypothetical protein
VLGTVWARRSERKRCVEQPGRETRAQREETRAQHEATAGQPPASVNGLGSGSARVSDPAATPDRRSPVSGSARVSDPAATPDRRSPVLESTNASTTPAAAQSDTDGELPSVSLVSESFCDDDSILRNEATTEPDDLGRWGRLPQGDAPGSELAPPGAELAPTDVAPVARAPTDVQRPRPRLTPEQELFNWRLKRYRAIRGLPPL